MRLFNKPRPLLASFVASAVALLPLLAMALFEITTVPSGVVDIDQVDDSSLRGAGLALVAIPFFYILGVPLCFAFGRLLMTLGLRRLAGFMVGSVIIAILLGLVVGCIISLPRHYGLNDVMLSVFIGITLVVILALPASLVWWFFAVRPHNSQFDTDAFGSGQSGRWPS